MTREDQKSVVSVCLPSKCCSRGGGGGGKGIKLDRGLGNCFQVANTPLKKVWNFISVQHKKYYFFSFEKYFIVFI